MSALRVVRAGLASTVQDRGRPGFAHLGVPPAGAVDPDLAALVNRLVGNPESAAVIETCGDLAVEATGAVLVATSTEGAARSIAAGGRVHLPTGHGRLWHYIAVRGGVDVAPVLGSRSTDTLSGLGPAPIAAGDRLGIGADPGTPIDAAAHAPLRPLPPAARITAGPRVNWFVDGSFERLMQSPWTVTAASRIGVRLTGIAIERERTGELPSEGLVRGAIQVPPDGRPVMMLADHPTTGGYPVLAVVHPDDVMVVAQRSVGDRLHFRA